MEHSEDNGGIFHWTAGRLVSGVAPPGSNYCIRAVTADGQITSYCYHFDLVASPRRMIPARRLREFALARDPGCPMCGVFDVRELLAWLGDRAGLQGDLVLMRAGRRVAALGRLGPGGLTPGQKLTVRFTAGDLPLVRDGAAGFEAVIVGAAGRTLFARPIRLKFPR